MRGLRRAINNLGIAEPPAALKLALKNIQATGNPLGEEPGKRHGWAAGLNLKTYTLDTGYLYFPCCVAAYDPKAQRIARSTAQVLSRLGIDFGILDGREVCCGEAVRKAGDENLFKSLSDTNLKLFAEKGVMRIIVSSPHCYHAFKYDYPDAGIEVIHFTELMSRLVKQGKLHFAESIDRSVAYHDPCYLGRHHGLYDEPRTVLSSIPGLKLVDLPHNRENALCCGGGGGHIWMETKKEERFSDTRVKQAIDAQSHCLATACPYCITNFDDSVLAGNSCNIAISDISELVLEAL